MNQKLEIIIYKDGCDTIRQSFDLLKISAEDFNPKEHLGKVFHWKQEEDEDCRNIIYCWKTCVPENTAEQELLISMGKIGGLLSNRNS